MNERIKELEKTIENKDKTFKEFYEKTHKAHELHIKKVFELTETVEKQKKEIEELQKRSYEYYGLSEQLKIDKKTLEETIKDMDVEIKTLKENVEILNKIRDNLQDEVRLKNKEINKAVHIIQGILGFGGIAMRLAIEPKAIEWLKENDKE